MLIYQHTEHLIELCSIYILSKSTNFHSTKCLWILVCAEMVQDHHMCMIWRLWCHIRLFMRFYGPLNELCSREGGKLPFPFTETERSPGWLPWSVEMLKATFPLLCWQWRVHLLTAIMSYDEVSLNLASLDWCTHASLYVWCSYIWHQGRVMHIYIYVCKNRASSLQIMACRLFGAKPLYEPTLVRC